MLLDVTCRYFRFAEENMNDVSCICHSFVKLCVCEMACSCHLYDMCIYSGNKQVHRHHCCNNHTLL